MILDLTLARDAVQRLLTVKDHPAICARAAAAVDLEIERLGIEIAAHEERQRRLDDRDEMERRYR